MYVYNPFGTAETLTVKRLPANWKKNTCNTTGRRYVSGRLGRKEFGLNANRIQHYENGARNPKFELCKTDSKALGKNQRIIGSTGYKLYRCFMFAFFEMETLYDLRLKKWTVRCVFALGKPKRYKCKHHE